jgi:hypothetical protein
MQSCGLNLPCTQTVPMETDISALQIVNSGGQGRAIEGSNTQSSDAAVLGTSTAPGGIGVNGTSTTPGGIGVKGVGTGLPAVEIIPAAIGVFGQSDFASGVQGQCGSTDTYLGSAGVVGVCTPTGSTPTGNGVVGVCNGPGDPTGANGNGVVGISRATNGVVGTTSADNACGVIGGNTSTDNTGVWRYGVMGIAAKVGYSAGISGSNNGGPGWAGRLDRPSARPGHSISQSLVC